MKPYFETALGKLYYGDCLSYMSFFHSKEINMILTDPPYGMNLDTDFSKCKTDSNFARDKGVKSGRKYDKVINDNIDYDPVPLLKRYSDVKEIFLFGADYYSDRLINKNDGSWLVWDKRITENFDKMYGSSFELIWSKNKHRREILRCKWAFIFGTEKQDIKKRVHPNQKPLKLIEDIILKYSKSNDMIADFYVGSGTIPVACERLLRRWIGIEISEKYCEISARRIELEARQGKFNL